MIPFWLTALSFIALTACLVSALVIAAMSCGTRRKWGSCGRSGRDWRSCSGLGWLFGDKFFAAWVLAYILAS
jgi:hypothetical protein